MRILVLNVGSSSVKYCAYDKNRVVTSGYVEGARSVKGREQAVERLIETLSKEGYTFDIAAHRVVHGAGMSETSFFTARVRRHIEQGCAIAPLHNVPELDVLDHLEARRKAHGFRQVVVFDSLPYDFDDVTRTYPIDRIVAQSHGIERVGFHGISHVSIRDQTRALIAPTPKRLITVHLGSGCSITGFSGKKAKFNSMGFTPLEGVVMATRPGSIDPGIIPYLLSQGMTAEQADDLLEHRSGLKGLSGTPDLATVIKNRKRGNRYDLAYRVFIRSISENIMRAAVAIGGVDTIAFSGTIGYRAKNVQRDVMRELKFLGEIQSLRIPTDEESVIRDEAERLVKASK